MTTDAPPQIRRLPVWLSACIIVVSLAGGAYVTYWYLFGSGSSGSDVVVLDRDPNDSVRQAGTSTWTVNSGGALLTITNPQKPDFELVFRRLDGLSSEQIRVLSAMRRIAGDEHVREILTITPEQMREIAQVRKGAQVQLSDADHATLSSAFASYRAAPSSDAKAKESAETALINTVEKVAKPLEEAANRSGAERANRAAKILTPEQWASYQQFGK